MIDDLLSGKGVNHYWPNIRSAGTKMERIGCGKDFLAAARVYRVWRNWKSERDLYIAWQHHIRSIIEQLFVYVKSSNDPSPNISHPIHYHACLHCGILLLADVQRLKMLAMTSQVTDYARRFRYLRISLRDPLRGQVAARYFAIAKYARNDTMRCILLPRQRRTGL